VLDREIEDILALDVQVRNRCRVGADIGFDELLRYDAVFLATGAHSTRPLQIEGEDLNGVFTGLDFLRRHNIDRSIRVGDRVLVIGGGNTAIDVVRTVLRLGGKPAILYRRTRNEMPAFCDEVEGALAEGAQLQELLSPVAIHNPGSNGLVVECAKMRLEASGSDGRPRPVPVDGENASFEADQVVLATGEMPDLSYLPEQLELSRGALPVSPIGQTIIENVFAGGDVIDQPWTVAAAIGSAKRSAIAIDLYLQGKSLNGRIATTMREHLGYAAPEDSDTVTVDQLNLAYDRPSHRAVAAVLPPAERVADFSEVNPGIGFDAAAEEARRCLSCGVCRMCGNCYLFCPDSAIKLDQQNGRYVVDYEYCKGCGICHNECPVSSILMTGDGELQDG
jgi:2-oxoacid:acceptor oxidoreductase delta subunit (pyruvate/2-ketoisovalerate family)